MVTLDRIRLTGLLRKTPAHAGVFYRSFTGGLVLVSDTACRGAITLEPLGAGARRCLGGGAGFGPCRVLDPTSPFRIPGASRPVIRGHVRLA
jgi:hypothetical protein